MKIKLENIGKTIKGQMIFQNVNVELMSGYIYGFVGYNGCGKTMLLRIISNLVKPSEGTISLDEQPYTILKTMPKIGIVLEKPDFFNELTGLENLEMLAKIRNEIHTEEIMQAIKTVGLFTQENKKVGKYSLGMRQRLGIAQAIMEDNDILILDEITSGLDEDGVNMIYEILKKEKAKGKLIIITSHNKIDIEELCDETYKFNNGTVHAYETD
ncbi:MULTISPECIES: ABC transporter ATP-binding protein [Bacillota]|jgi:ABC-2 type transport system ATP-binding protein|uniref:ABC transporter ATP-binding protein n=2 Tax=Amedibacillus TaxID=2749846 RepID=A0A7G9GPY4_9FIRM|nr:MULTISPECIES: ABC transporter ATP-binding protein [Bacillota]QNM12866.1 ABC transporter ATP-binding protein [[Eubacterium] hominis]MCH4286747.1 ABC transporter ATP-binding protein [Amedibacillus hominis]RGB58172.1 ABC transporter ATP-binding protein [Absiella sp. AM22-9]RGB59945.1 ABC transporter ATP-binding protein [Absiella sp. AM10-20]RGB66018.1 ABC transporter ATP-binding protein [Absiella sp. AM09-45]